MRIVPRQLTGAALLVATQLVSGAVAAAAPDEAAASRVEQSRALAQRLGAELKAELGRALQSGGPVAAISVCRYKAPEIAGRLSQESGAIVGRTALRLRNPANAPSDWQREGLERFAADLAAGKAPAELESLETVSTPQGVEHRYLRAIVTEPVCVTCHGTTLAPDVAAAVAKDYPQDRATGFEPGQLRGAFSVVWPAPR